MRIKKLRLKNIRSYEEQEIEFPAGSLLLSGDVGSGKTTILLALEFALFGMQPGQKGSALLRNNAENGEVTLEFEVDGLEVIIERKLKRNSKSISSESSVITVNGERIEFSVTELKTKILQILGYPPEFLKKNNILYRYTVYTPQEQMKNIISEDPEVRLNVLRHIFGIEKYRQIRDNLTIVINSLKENSKFFQGEIKDLDSDRTKLESIKSYLENIKVRIKEKELEIEEKKKIRREKESEILELESKIKEKERFDKEVEKAQILIGSKKETLSSTNKEILELEKSLAEEREIFSETRFNEINDLLNKNKELLEKTNSRYIEILSRIKLLEQNMKENLEKKERIFKIDFCHTCLQDVPSSHKHNIMNETDNNLSNLKKNFSLLGEEKNLIESHLDKQKSEILKLEQNKIEMEILKSKKDYLEKSKKKKENLMKTRDNLEKDISLLSRHLDNLKEQILNFSKFYNLFKIKQDELKKSFVDEKNSEISFAELKKESELTSKEINDLSELIKNKELSKEKLSNTLNLIDWLSNQFIGLINFTERNVLMKLRMEFSKLFSKWFTMLAGDSFEVRLDENFTPVVMQREIEMDYEFLSGGERTAIALAYRLSLNQTINSVISTIKTRDIVILDEPTDGFSEVQLEKIREILAELKISQVILVSHEQKIEGFVENVIRLKKENDSSYIEIPQSIKEIFIPKS